MDKIIPIVIPSYEPDGRFIRLLEELNRNGLGPVIVINDGSSEAYDGYFGAAENDHGAMVLRHERNRGKGKALKTAFSFCLDSFPQMAGCITVDSDGQHTVAAIMRMRDRLLQCPDALVLGVRDFDGAGIPRKSQFGNNLTRKVFKLLYKQDLADTQTGLRAIPAEHMRALLSVPGDRFEFETRMLIWAVEQGISIEQVPIETIYDSKENHSTHFRPVVDSIRIYRVFGFSFGKFVLSSLSSSVVDLVAFQLLCNIFKSGAVGVRYVAVATVIARIISASYNYLVNYYLVFQSKEHHLRSACKYFSLAAVQMLCSAALTTGFVYLTGVKTEILIKIPIDVTLFFISYRIQKKLIY